MTNNKNILYCSFCGKSQHEVKKLIAGPTVFICDECVELCMDIIKEENKTSLIFYTSLQDEIVLTKKNPILIEVNDKNEPSPYLLVRNNLRGLISRSVYYELIEYAQERTIEDKNFLTIESNNEIFKMFEIK